MRAPAMGGGLAPKELRFVSIPAAAKEVAEKVDL
jgi:hypothetical protein